jgi:hypothetical protein
MSNRQAPIDTRFRIEPRYTSSPKPPGPPQEGWQRLGWFREARDYPMEAKLGGGKQRDGGARLRAQAFLGRDCELFAKKFFGLRLRSNT